MPDDIRRELDALSAAIDSAEPVVAVADDGDWGGDEPPPGSAGDADFNRELAQYDQNDTGNARRLRRRFGSDLLFVDQIGWHCWDGRRFAYALGEPRAVKRAQWTQALMLRFEVKALRDEGPPPPSDLELEESDPTERKLLARERVQAWGKTISAMQRHALGSGNAGKIRGMLDMARGDLTVTPDVIDADPWLLNCLNGTVELDRRREVKAARAAASAVTEAYDGCSDPPEPVAPPWPLHAHRRTDRLTRLAGCEFRPSAACPTFMAFIERILPDPDVRAFVQRLLGYCLVGMTEEQIFVIFWGTGKNGKSKLVDIVREIFGDYAATVPAGLFLEKRNDDPDKPRPSLAKLPGKRLVLMSEPKRKGALDEGLVKELTGGEPISARKLHQDEFEFRPNFTPIMSANHKPDIRGLDTGLWRRIMLVPFEITIPPEERDPALLDKLRPEKDAILNWILDGLWEYQLRGLAPPEKVTEAVEEYKRDSDPIGEFLDAETAAIPNCRVQATELYDRYTQWCERNAHDPIGKKSFGLSMKERGFRQVKSSNNYWQGLDLLKGVEPESSGLV